MNNRIYWFLFTLIVIIAFFLRIYNIANVPNGLSQDETSIGYNAYSILTTGKDEYGKDFPLYFKAFGEYKLPVSVYLTSISIAFLGLNEFAVRLPFALFGALTVVLLFFILRLIYKEKNNILPIIATSLFAINPWHLHFSRGVFEVTIALFLIVVGVLFFLFYIEKKKILFIVLSASFFALSVYTYNIARIFSILLFCFLVISYSKKPWELKSKENLPILVFLIFLIPFLISVLSPQAFGSTTGTLIFSSNAILAPLLELRSYLVDLPSIYTQLFYNKWILFLVQYFKNIESYFSADFFFVSGSPHGNHGIGNTGMFYLFEMPLMIIGFITLFRNRLTYWIKFMFAWAILVIGIASLTREAPHATRSFFLIVPLVFLSAIGLVTILNYLAKQVKNRFIKIMGLVILQVLVAYNIAYYLTSYYVRFPVLYSKAWKSEDKALSAYLLANLTRYDKIIFDDDAGFVYTSLLFYSAYPPADFQANTKRASDDKEGFSKVVSFGKYEFKKVDWENDYNAPRTLIITNEKNKPANAASSKIFYYPIKPIVFSVKEELVQYPVTEIAYVLVETGGQ